MTVEPGQTLLHYTLTEKLGEGGMGVVWRGRDTKLDRDVAIKILPGDFAQHPDRLARFEREAKLLASLNHANIATIHGLEHDAGVHFLAMELVEGEDLAERIGRGAIPVEEALPLALQIASAFEAAHERGVIHRDLKPANVKVTPEGTVKVLDFGLAKAFGPDVQDPNTSPTMSPTVTSAGSTAVGVILGTAAYMSPEQAKGKPVDRRADIWSFGVVLLEMLTGRLSFRGESVSETLAAVLMAEPDLTGLPANTPPRVRRLIERCLRKDPQSRLRDIGDARVVVEESLAGREWETAASEQQAASKRAPVWVWAIVAAALIAGLALGRTFFSTVEPSASGPVHAELNLPEGTRLNGWGTPVVALSPDGSTVAFVADLADGTSRLFVRSLDSPTAIEVPDSDTAEGPFFSPDGRRVAFGAGVSLRSGRSPELLKYSLDTGLTQAIAPLYDYFGGVWRDDDQLFFFNTFGTGIWQVSATGGEPRAVFTTFREEDEDGEASGLALIMPAMLPGGRKIVATESALDSARIVVIDLETGDRTIPGVSGNQAFPGPNGRLIVTNDEGTLYSVPFDAKSGEATGAPVALMDGLSLSRFGVAVAAASPAGNLVYSRGPVRGSRIVPSRMFRVDRSGSERVLPFDPEIISRGFAVSPSGDRLAVAVRGSGVWIYDLERETRKNLPMDGLNEEVASIVWSPDGKRIAFNGLRGEQVVLAQQTIDGVGKPEVTVAKPGFELYAGSWLPDGKGFTYVEAGPEDSRIMVHRLDQGAEPEVLADGVADLSSVRVSPDGRWFAFDSAASGDFQIYAQAMTLDSERVVVSAEGGVDPRWSPDSSELFFVNAGRLMAVDVPREPGDSFGRPRLILETDFGEEYSVGPEGDFYSYRPVEGVGIRRKLNLVLGWSAE